ncbi:MAG: citrate transporter [bacterium]
MIAGLPVPFILFALVLAGVAVLHRRTFEVAVAGAGIITAYRLLATPFSLPQHLLGEWMLLLNLFGLLMGFALLARHFSDSHLPAALPRWLPSGWTGGLLLLVAVFVLSAFLDNIAAALIGGTLAMVVFRGHVHVGFLAAIVAASNAGGAGSVLGDTTTTMLWLGGVSPRDVLHAYVGAGASLLFFGVVAARQQQRHHPIVRGNEAPCIDGGRLLIVAGILAGAITANILVGLPAAGVWLAILAGAMFRKTHWHELRRALKGSLFLVALVWCASLMPVESLPPASVGSAFALGALSAVFDNIPLTKLMLDQGGYDWGFVAYAVGFGGSMTWFGSSAGVALTNLFPQGRSVWGWLRHGWHVPVAYVLGFAVLFLLMGWHPHAPHRRGAPPPERVAPQQGLRNPTNGK